MISYKDKTFCVSSNCKNECGRKLTKEIKQASEKWWGSPDAPICVGYFCEEKEKENGN